MLNRQIWLVKKHSKPITTKIDNSKIKGMGARGEI